MRTKRVPIQNAGELRRSANMKNSYIRTPKRGKRSAPQKCMDRCTTTSRSRIRVHGLFRIGCAAALKRAFAPLHSVMLQLMQF